ncbi:ShlB/FhaC/HecB family hemolysin secretion/activation protein [Limobrevibacterium gyesilva]|uniref:BamA/TamA family outer membrane protein n=1 Tax=Limobrevibacterium gyesilva TaxID=2991712 RepID=A0AA41YKJ0_9PROT|nr:ShlB/FhaC/HecB family hemolysin secretion/activation protein [Limobrevibacterium gyesilva]MCW3473887.1 BamA/TamA family outer membrane protein [Limobrevibacterium gyesilva]
MALATTVAAAIPASAQEPPRPVLLPEGSPIPRIMPPQQPSVSPGALVPPPTGPAGPVPEVPVTIRSVAIEGATQYPTAELMRLADGLVGEAVPLPRVDAARQAILRRYRDDGFVLTAVSAALDANGNLRFRVTEGRIADVKLDGDIGPAGTQVLRFLNRLTEEKVIDSRTLERYLLLAQDVPGVALRAILKPSTDEPGALTLVAQVSRRPVTGLFTSDNRAFNLTGPEQGLGVVDFNSFTEYGERTQVSLYRTYNNTQLFGQVSTEVFLGASGLKLRVYGGAGSSDPSGSLRAIGYQGQTTVFGGELAYPLIRSRQQTLNLYGTFDALESIVNQNTGVNGSSARVTFDSLRVVRGGVGYALSDLWLGDERPAVNAVSVRVSRGLPWFGASPNGAALNARLGERVDFLKASFDITRTQNLFQPWNGAGLALMGILSGQVSPNVLPPAEKFFLGGSRITRGFYSGQVTGDNALAATVELQLNTAVNTQLLGYGADVSLQFYGFYDWGETWENQKSDPNRRLQSFGGGVRMMLTPYTEVDLEGVRRLTVYPNGSSTGISALPNTAFYWRVLTRF